MTRDELIELARRLLVLAGMMMEDLSPDLVAFVEDDLAVRIKAEILRQGADTFAILAKCADLLGRLAEQASE